MSHFSYEESKRISAIEDWNFDALIMAAIRKADDFNGAALQAAFPGLYEEFRMRYHAPGGVLPGEIEEGSV